MTGVSVKVVDAVDKVVLLGYVVEHVADLLDAGVDGLLWDVLQVVNHIISPILLPLQTLKKETLSL